MEIRLRGAFLSCVLLGAGSFMSLQAQNAQARAKVAPAIPAYTPAVIVKGTLDIPGSDALQDLGEEWNRVFKRHHPEGAITFTAMLSPEAIAQLVTGKKALILSARELNPEEMNKFKETFGYQPMRIPICLDANIVFVHKGNPLSSISLQELDAIYSTTRLGGLKAPIVTWGDLKVRGELAKRTIHAYARAEGAATRSSFQATAMKGGEFRAEVIGKDDSPALAEAIATDEAGIAFGPLTSWSAANKILSVAPYGGSDDRFPNQENVTTSRYPMPRLYFAYLNRPPGKPLDPALNEFLHFALSREGQEAAAEVGLLPGPPEFLTIALKRLDR